MRPVFIRFSPVFRKKSTRVTLLFFLLFMAWYSGRQLAKINKYWVKYEPGLTAKAIKALSIFVDYNKIVFNTLPILASTQHVEASTGLEPSEENLFTNPLAIITENNFANPKKLIQSQFPLLKMVNTASGDYSEKIYEDREEELIPELEDGAFEEEKPNPVIPEFIASEKPLVAIYNTHNAETYTLTDGKPKLEGKNAGVTKLAVKLEEVLNTNGVRTIRSTTIHDYPSFPKSYGNSEKTVKAMLSGNPSVQIVIDIHRDAGIKKREVVKINGQDTAKILLIVGTNTRLEHPYWKKNKAFAEKVIQKMNELYPGLSKGIRMQDGRYNQHVHPNAILIEVGNDETNTLEEAERATALFGQVIIHLIADLQKTKI